MQEDPAEMDELALVKAILRGKPEAFRGIVLRYEAEILTYLTRMVGDRESARDLVQETFLAAYQALPRWYPSSKKEQSSRSLAPWLYRIATNKALNFLKKQPYALSFSQQCIENREDTQQEKASKSATQPEEQYILRETLQEALRTLTEEEAACLVLRFGAGERYAEIAQTLHLTSEAVRKRVSRGLIALRVAYQQFMEVPQ
jgi:RNA polymerase sigma factor (sigma-70 family)